MESNVKWEEIIEAVKVVEKGIVKRCDVTNATVYACGTIIRIDIKR